MDSFVTFTINEQIMGIKMLNVERIIKLLKVSPIPDSCDYIEGIIDVQDELIPTINLKKKFNFPSQLVGPDSSVIIISEENEKCGIIVDLVDDIVEVNDTHVIKTKNNKYVYGVVKINDTIINLLNSNTLVLE